MSSRYSITYQGKKRKIQEQHSVEVAAIASLAQGLLKTQVKEGLGRRKQGNDPEHPGLRGSQHSTDCGDQDGTKHGSLRLMPPVAASTSIQTSSRMGPKWETVQNTNSKIYLPTNLRAT